MKQNDSVFLLYEGDEWLSKDSLVLMGVFSSLKSLDFYADKLIRERGKKHLETAEEDGWLFDEGFTEEEKVDEIVGTILLDLMDRKSTDTWSINYLIKEATLDKLEEI